MIVPTERAVARGIPGVATATRASWSSTTAAADGGRPEDRALLAVRDHLIAAQDPGGFWVGELEGDSILESEYVLLMAYLGREHDTLCRKMARVILEEQNEEGGWSTYPGGPSQVSATVKSYFVLKLLGRPVDDPVMVRARAVVHRMGGAQACNSFTRFLPGAPGADPVRGRPVRPARIAVRPAEGRFQPGVDVELDADDHRPADGHRAVQARPPAPRRARDRRTLPTRRRRPRPGKKYPSLSWENFFTQV